MAPISGKLKTAITINRWFLYILCGTYALVVLAYHSNRATFTLRFAWTSYLFVLRTRPLITKCMTSMVGFCLGDSIAQHLTSEPSRQTTHDWQRTARFMSFGFLLHAPACHWFFQALDEIVRPDAPRSWTAVLLKVLADRFLLTPVLMAGCFSYIKLMEGHWEDIQRTLSEKLWRTWLISQLIWPLAHVVNFAFVPSEQRVLFVNFVSVFWNVVLCQMASSGPRAASFLRGKVSRRPSRIMPLSSIRQES